LINDYFTGKISDTEKVDWTSTWWMRRDNLTGGNARLLLNNTSLAKATPLKVKPREADADRFWKSILQISNLFDREKSVVAQPSMLKSIARVFYEIKWSDQKLADDTVPETELPICLLHLQTIRIQTAGSPRLPVTNEIMRKITAITSNT
jgi:hypothetical protein